jgi:uncharacterized membrane protein
MQHATHSGESEALVVFILYPGGGWIGMAVLIGTALLSWFLLRRFLLGGWATGGTLRRLGGEGDDGWEADHLEVLKRRYSRGEITREEYQRMRDDLKD